MQMDINKIFGLFDSSSIDMPLVEKAKAADSLLNIQDTPVFWVGMFKKILLNTKSLYTQLYKNLPKEVIEEISGMDDIAEMVTYSRSWYYISKINLDNSTDIDALKVFADEDLILGINLSIKYFEEREEYEKCAHLKRIQDKVETFVS
jgi:hypothetical protein